MATFTNNYNFVLQAFNDNSGTWGTTGAGGEPGLNSGIFAPLDAILGNNITIAIAAGNNSISLTNWLNKIFILTGTLTGNANVFLPLSPNSVGSATAVGGEFIVINQTTGNFQVAIFTSATSSTGVFVPQSKVSLSSANDTYSSSVLYSDGVNVRYADRGGVIAFAQGVNGNPTGQIAGISGSLNTNAQLAYDYTNNNLYVCTTTGPAGTAVYTNPVLGGQTIPTPQGYLTLSSNVQNPVLTGDVVGGTILYYTPFVGNWTAVFNGSNVIPFKFSQTFLVLSTSQAANQIYDIFYYYNGGSPVIMSGPAWSSATAGSSSRGGSAPIARDTNSGLWVNSGTQTMIANVGAGNVSVSVANATAFYLGSIFMDGTAGQVSCYRSWGQNRKFGVWNAYNRMPISMVGGDSTTSWSYASPIWRYSNNNSNNKILAFTGLQEEYIDSSFGQNVSMNIGGSIGIGFNISASTPGGFLAQGGNQNTQPIFMQGGTSLSTPPSLGYNNLNMLESVGTSSSLFFGNQFNMQLTVKYRG